MISDKDKAKFLAQVDKKNDDQCWDWKGSQHGRGYGIIYISSKQKPAHQIAWIIHHGEQPTNNVKQTCGNKLCCNPNHLTSHNDEERFWSNVEIKNEDDCWKWIGGTDNGLGIFSYNNKNELAHRAAWTFHNKEPLTNKFIYHTCNNKLCCNPKHLLLQSSDKDRFWSKVHIKSEDECWEYLEAKQYQGYGKFWLNQKEILAHIAAWYFSHEEIPDEDVLHTCCNKSCCNPKHLKLRYNNKENVLIARFWNKVDKSPGQGDSYSCWMWTSGLWKDGYGKMRWREGNEVGAHRISWEIHNGPIPDKMEVCHKCDNPGCVNPEHLFLGTHKENMEDRERKGRRTASKGEKNGMSKLVLEQVIEIKNQLKNGTSGADLARKYGVSKTQISWIKLGKSWKDV